MTAATTLTGSLFYLSQGGTLDRKLGADTTIFSITGGLITITPGSITGTLLASGSAVANIGYTPLNPANNLSDVANVATARTNLGLGTGNSPTFTGLTLSGLSGVGLRCVDADASGVLHVTTADCGTGTGGGSPGGTSGQIQYNNAGAFGGFTPGGDVTFANPNFTVTKIGGQSVTGLTFPASGTLLTSTLAGGQIFVGSAGNVATGVAASGDATLVSTGAFTVQGLRGRTVAATAPADTNVLCWVAASTNWQPCATTAGSGTVGSGAANAVAYYASAGTAVSATNVSANSVLVTSALNVPSLSPTLPAAVQGNITSVGTVTGGTWNATPVAGQFGGTGVNNGSNTITIGGGNFATAGAGTLTLTTSGTSTNATFPTGTGTLMYNALASANLYVGNVSGVATGVSPSGDVTGLTNTGAFTVGKVNGVAYGASPGTNTVPVVTGANTVTYEAVPNVALANSTVTLGSTTVALGASASTVTGLTLANPTVTGTLAGTGVVPNGALVNSSMTVGGATCTLGSSCAPSLTGGALPSGNIFVGNISNIAAAVPASGDISAISPAGAFTVANNAISNAKFRQSAGLSVVGVAGSATANVADITGTANQVLVVNSAGNSLGFGPVNLASGSAVTGQLVAGSFPALTGDVTSAGGSLSTSVSPAAITYAKFQNVAANSLVGNPTGTAATAQAVGVGATLTFASGLLQTVALTGDVTSSANSFATTVAPNAVTHAKMQQEAATSFPCNPTAINPANMTGCTFGSEFTFSGSTLHFGGNPNTVNRVTTGTTNTLTIATAVTTEIWKSATAGAKTENIPGCASQYNGYYLYEVDEQGTAGIGNITITPASGTIGPLASPSYVLASNFITAAFVCDAAVTNWALVYTSAPGATVRNSTSTTLTVAGTDNGGIIQQNAATAVTASIGDTGTTGFPVGGYVTTIQNIGAGLITLTPTTQTINGLASLLIGQNQTAIVTALPASGAGYSAIIMSAQTQEVPLSWIAGINPNGVSFANFTQSKRIVAIRCTVEAGIAGAGTVHVYKAASGTAIASGTDLTDSVACNAFNPALATDQSLATATPANWVLAAGNRLGIVTTGAGGNWTSGAGIGVMTVVLQ